MNDSKIETAYFVGNSSPTSWSSLYFHTPHIPAQKESHGELFSLVSLSCPTTFDAQKAGNFLIDKLHDEYFDSNDESILVRLEKSVLQTKKRLLQLLENDEVTSEHGIEFSLISMVVHDNYAYVVNLGESKIYGFRGNKIADISSVLKDPDGKKNIKVASFKVSEDDRFMLITNHSDKELKHNEKQLLLEGFSVEYLEGRELNSNPMTGIGIIGIDLNYVKKSNVVHQNFIESSIKQTNGLITNSYQKERINQEEKFEKKFIDHPIENKEDKGANTKNFSDIFKSIENKVKNIKDNQNSKTIQTIFARGLDKLLESSKNFGIYFWYDFLKMGNGNMHIRGTNVQKNYRPIIFFGILILLGGYFTISSILTSRKNAQHEFEMNRELDSIVGEKENLNDEIAILTNSFDKESEKGEVLGAVQSLEDRLEKIDLFEDRKDEIENDLNLMKDNITRNITIESPEIIVDFGSIEGTLPSDIDIYNSNVYVSDEKSGTIYSFDYSGGTMEKVTTELKEPKTISFTQMGEIIFVDKNTDRGVGKINLESGELIRFPGISQTRLSDVSEIDAYTVGDNNHRIYISRGEQKDVLQMRRNGENYGFPEPRLSKGDFANLLDIEISDGRIFLISEGQGLRRFLKEEEFKNDIRGAVDQKDFSSVTSLFVDERYIYLGDTQNKSIYILTKFRGDSTSILDYVATYDLSKALNDEPVLDLVADRKKDSIFVLAGTKVIKLNMDSLNKFDY